MTRNGYYVVLDFDGTVVKHRYPAVGEDIGAVPVLRKLVQNGHDLLLSTMRSRDSEGVDTLQPALDWFASNDIPLYGVNENGLPPLRCMVTSILMMVHSVLR